jgi:uncharacterized membrane protein
MIIKLFAISFFIMHLGTIALFIILGHFSAFKLLLNFNQISAISISCAALVFIVLPFFYKIGRCLNIQNLGVYLFAMILFILNIFIWYIVSRYNHGSKMPSDNWLIYTISSNIASILTIYLFFNAQKRTENSI